MDNRKMIMVGFNNEAYDYPLLHHFINHIDEYHSGQLTAQDLYSKSQYLIEEKFTEIKDSNKYIRQLDLYKIWHFNNVARATSLKDLENHLKDVAKELDVDIECYQSNSEGDIVTKIQDSRLNKDFVLINAGAYTHTSVAIRDALTGVDLPFYEIHMSNFHRREEFRQHSYLSDVAVGVIAGFGLNGYEYALRAAVEFLGRNR